MIRRKSRAKPKRKPVDPYSPEKLDEELAGLLSAIPLYEPGSVTYWCDEKETKVFAINLARLLSHHGLSVEQAATLLRSNILTVRRWLNAHRKRTSLIVENIGRHLGLGPTILCDRVLSFQEIEGLRLGEGWYPKKGWNQSRRRTEIQDAPRPVNDDDDDDDGSDWWKLSPSAN